MAADLESQMLNQYREELTFLRRMGAKFARKYPRVAKRLELDGTQSPDPHVERLLEGVAFLTARLQHNLAGELPEISAGMLGFLYPHFIQPVPAMAMAQLEPDEGGAGMTTGLEVPRHTKLYVETSFQRRTARFRTCYPVTLWPISVTEVRVQSPGAYDFLAAPGFRRVQTVVKVSLKTNSESLHVLDPKSLRFFLDGEARVTGMLYELLATELMSVAILPNGDKPARNAEVRVCQARPCGFDEEETVLPTAPNGLRGYSLLQEYFAFPEKFLFTELEGLDFGGAEDTVDLLFLFTKSPARRLSVDNETFRLGCSPIVNLFDKVSEPIHVDGRRDEYLVTPDSRWERTTEIHSIKAVTTTLRDEAVDDRVLPLYGLGHSSDEGVVYFDARRRPARGDMPGTDVWMSFVDANLTRELPPAQTLRAHTLCTNRDLASHVDQGERLHIEDGPHALVTTLTRPTHQISPPMQGASLWRLVSHLALSHLGLPSGAHATEALREQLRCYAFTTAESVEPLLRAIVDVERETIALRADDEAWRGFVRVQRVTVTVDEGRFAAGSPILLGAVLNEYLGLHASVNVFTQLAMKSRQREGIWHVWPAKIPKATVR